LSVILLDLPPVYWVLPLSDITNEAMASIRSTLKKDYSFVRLERIEANGVQIDRLVGRYAESEGYFVQTYMVVEHTLHVLTFYSPEEQFEDNLTLFDSILASYSPSGK
jgi:hypothetical protein